MSRVVRYSAETRLNLATGEYDTKTPIELLALDVLDWADAGRDRPEMKAILESSPGQVATVSVSVGAGGFVSVRHWEDAVDVGPLIFNNLSEMEDEEVVGMFERVHAALRYASEN